MALESGTYISDLVSTNPVEADNVSTTNDHLWLLKSTIKTTFPNVTGAVNPTQAQLNFVVGVTSLIQTQMDLKAALASPTLTGTPLAPTAAPGTNTTQLATTAYATALAAVGISGQWKLLKSTAISGTPLTVDLVNGSAGVVIDATYDEYMVSFIAVLPSTDGAFLWLRTSTDAGVSYAAAGSDYSYIGAYNAGGGLLSFTGTGAAVVLTDDVGTAANEVGVFGTLRFYKPSAAAFMHGDWTVAFREATAGSTGYVNAVFFRAAAFDVDAIRFMFSTGTMASGTINLFGRKL